MVHPLWLLRIPAVANLGLKELKPLSRNSAKCAGAHGTSQHERRERRRTLTCRRCVMGPTSTAAEDGGAPRGRRTSSHLSSGLAVNSKAWSPTRMTCTVARRSGEGMRQPRGTGLEVQVENLVAGVGGQSHCENVS